MCPRKRHLRSLTEHVLDCAKGLRLPQWHRVGDVCTVDYQPQQSCQCPWMQSQETIAIELWHDVECWLSELYQILPGLRRSFALARNSHMCMCCQFLDLECWLLISPPPGAALDQAIKVPGNLAQSLSKIVLTVWCVRSSAWFRSDKCTRWVGRFEVPAALDWHTASISRTDQRDISLRVAFGYVSKPWSIARRLQGAYSGSL